MNEMIERVAKVICTRIACDCADDCHICIGQAKAAIEAMREPTERMIEAGGESVIYGLSEKFGPTDDEKRFTAENVWNAMIDACVLVQPLVPER